MPPEVRKTTTFRAPGATVIQGTVRKAFSQNWKGLGPSTLVELEEHLDSYLCFGASNLVDRGDRVRVYHYGTTMEDSTFIKVAGLEKIAIDGGVAHTFNGPSGGSTYGPEESSQ